jgi:hypothetical protein
VNWSWWTRDNAVREGWKALVGVLCLIAMWGGFMLLAARPTSPWTRYVGFGLTLTAGLVLLDPWIRGLRARLRDREVSPETKAARWIVVLIGGASSGLLVVWLITWQSPLVLLPLAILTSISGLLLWRSRPPGSWPPRSSS